MNSDPSQSCAEYGAISIIPYVDPELIRMLTIAQNVATENVNTQSMVISDKIIEVINSISEHKFDANESLRTDAVAVATRPQDMISKYHKFVSDNFEELEREIDIVNNNKWSDHKIKLRGVWHKFADGKQWCAKVDGTDTCPATFAVEVGKYGIMNMNRAEYGKQKTSLDEELSKKVMEEYLKEQMVDPKSGVLTDEMPADPLPENPLVYGQDWAFFSYLVPPFERLLKRYVISATAFSDFFSRECVRVFVLYTVSTLIKTLPEEPEGIASELSVRQKFGDIMGIADSIMKELSISTTEVFSTGVNLIFDSYVRPSERLIQLFKIHGVYPTKDYANAACQEAHTREKYVDAFPMVVGKWYTIPNNPYIIKNVRLNHLKEDVRDIKANIFAPAQGSAFSLRDLLRSKLATQRTEERMRELAATEEEERRTGGVEPGVGEAEGIAEHKSSE